MRRLVDGNATDILAVSSAAMTAWGFDQQQDPRCEVILNGIDLDQYREPVDAVRVRHELGVPPGDRLCVHVARPGPEKNRERVVEVFAELRRRGHRASLLFVGGEDGRETHALRRRAHQLDVRAHVAFAGERDDVPRVLQAADLLLFPSLREGLPGAVLEACAAGTPVLASDLPSIKEVAAVFSTVTCYSLSESDVRWAEAAEKLLARPPTEQTRADALRTFAASPFSLETALARYVELWAVSA